MSTRIYLPSSGAAPISPVFDAAWADTGGAIRLTAKTFRIVTPFAERTRAETASAVHNVLLCQYVIGPLAAQTITGTIKGQIRARESASLADFRSQMVVRVVSGDGLTVRGTLRAADTAALSSEWINIAAPASARNASFPLRALSPQTLTDVVVSAGDYLVIELGYRAHNTVTTSYTGAIRHGDSAVSDLPEDDTSTGELNPWIEFSADLLWLPRILRATQTLLEGEVSRRVPLRVTQTLLEADLFPRVPLRVTQTLLEVDRQPPAIWYASGSLESVSQVLLLLGQETSATIDSASFTALATVCVFPTGAVIASASAVAAVFTHVPRAIGLLEEIRRAEGVVVEVLLRRLTGAPVALFTSFEHLQVESAVDGIGGGLSLRLGGDEKRVLDVYDMLEPDMFVEVWWRDDLAEIPPRLEGGHCLLLDTELWQDDSGWHLQIVAVGLRHLLSRVMCLAAANTVGGVKSGPTETVVKQFVSQEISRIGYPQFSVATDLGGGPIITLNGFNRSLLAICQQAHEMTGGDFVVIGNTAAQATFDWLPGGMGTDRRTTLRFGILHGNVMDPRLTHQRSKQITHVKVLGQGEGATRETALVGDAVRASESKWGRIESTRDARDVPIGGASQLVARGVEVLQQNRSVRKWAFEVLQTPGVRYGRDYFLGDRVRAELGRDWVDRVISAVVFSVGHNQLPMFSISTEEIV